MLRVGVLVSGGGTNLQAILDAIDAGTIRNAKVEVVISNNAGAFALERAKKHGIPAECLSPKEFASREEFNEALVAKIDSYHLDLIVLAGYLVKIPAAVPSLISGLKVAATYSVSGAVVGEWIGAQKGLGYYLLRVKNGYMLDKVFACVLVIIFLSLCMNLALWLANRIASPSGRRQAQAGSRGSAS